MNRTSAVTLFCRNNCITFVRFRLIGEFMDFSSQILHFVFLHYAIQAEKARFRVTAAVTLFVSALARRTSLILQKQKKRLATSPLRNVSDRFVESCVCCFTVVEANT